MREESRRADRGRSRGGVWLTRRGGAFRPGGGQANFQRVFKCLRSGRGDCAAGLERSGAGCAGRIGTNSGRGRSGVAPIFRGGWGTVWLVPGRAPRGNTNFLTTMYSRCGRLLCEIGMVIPLYHADGQPDCAGGRFWASRQQTVSILLGGSAHDSYKFFKTCDLPVGFAGSNAGAGRRRTAGADSRATERLRAR